MTKTPNSIVIRDTEFESLKAENEQLRAINRELRGHIMNVVGLTDMLAEIFGNIEMDTTREQELHEEFVRMLAGLSSARVELWRHA